MTSAELTTYWQMNFGISPKAHLLREACHDRWFRIHTLPESNRYPETEAEYEVVLSRHNEVLSSLIASESETILLTTGYSFATDPQPVQNLKAFDPESWYWKTIRVDPEDPESPFWHLFARQIVWRPGTIDSLLRLVAQDVLFNVMVIGIRGRVLYHPYDGGGDVIARDVENMELLKGRFSQWLSPHPSGL